MCQKTNNLHVETNTWTVVRPVVTDGDIVHLVQHVALRPGRASPDLDKRKIWQKCQRHASRVTTLLCIIGLVLKPVLSWGPLWSPQGKKRSSVTSEPDSLITNAAKDLLVYQSEPRALPFPSGDGNHYHEPVGPWPRHSSCPGPVTPGQSQSHAPVDTRTHAIWYTHINNILRLWGYIHTCSCAPEQGHKQTEKRRHICKHELACICPHKHWQTQIHKDSHKTWTTKASMWAMNLLCFETKAELKQRQDQRREGERERERESKAAG